MLIQTLYQKQAKMIVLSRILRQLDRSKRVKKVTAAAQLIVLIQHQKYRSKNNSTLEDFQSRRKLISIQVCFLKAILKERRKSLRINMKSYKKQRS